MISSDILKYPMKVTISYSLDVLYKYNKDAEFLGIMNASLVNGKIDKTIIEQYLVNNNISQSDEVNNAAKEFNYTPYMYGYFDSNGKFAQIDILDQKIINKLTYIAPKIIENLEVIVAMYCKEDYNRYFNKKDTMDISIDIFNETAEDKTEKIDPNIDLDLAFQKILCHKLKDIKNLISYMDGTFEHAKIILDNRNVTLDPLKTVKDKKKFTKLKDHQVIVENTQYIKRIAKELLKVYLEDYLVVYNPFRNIHTEHNYFVDKITSDIVEKDYQRVKSILESKRKLLRSSSPITIFRGFISNLVHHYFLMEGIDNNIIDERDKKLLSYYFLCINGLIETKRITIHKNRDERIKYVESFPKWSGVTVPECNFKIANIEEVINKAAD